MFVVMCSDPGIQKRARPDSVDVKNSAVFADGEIGKPDEPERLVLANSGRYDSGRTYTSGRSAEEELDLTDLNFHDYEEAAIKSGFSRITTSNEPGELLTSTENMS